MTIGNIVIYLDDPLAYGKMIILAITPDGRILCESIHKDDTGEHQRNVFTPHELELADKWTEAIV